MRQREVTDTYRYMTFRNIEKYQDWLEDVFKADDALEKSLSVDSAVSHSSLHPSPFVLNISHFRTSPPAHRSNITSTKDSSNYLMDCEMLAKSLCRILTNG